MAYRVAVLGHIHRTATGEQVECVKAELSFPRLSPMQLYTSAGMI